MKARVRSVPIMQINDVLVAKNSKNIARNIWIVTLSSFLLILSLTKIIGEEFQIFPWNEIF